MTRLRAALTRLRREPRAAAVALLGAGVLVVSFVDRCSSHRPPREQNRVEQAAASSASAATTAAADEQRARVRRVETRAERRPDGAELVHVVEEEREEARSATTATASAASAAIAETQTIVVREPSPRPSWRVTGAVGWQLDAPTLRPAVYGLDVSRRVAGPLWLGAWARTDRTAGVSLAVEW